MASAAYAAVQFSPSLSATTRPITNHQKQFKMKTIILTIALATVAAFASAQVASKQTIIIKTKIYCDHCEKCETCGQKFAHDIPFIKGVSDYKFDTKAQTITLTYNPKKTTPDALRKAISLIGYDADNVKADAKAVEKLDGCCKK
jgi:mercuric ion binding protein